MANCCHTHKHWSLELSKSLKNEWKLMQICSSQPDHCSCWTSEEKQTTLSSLPPNIYFKATGYFKITSRLQTPWKDSSQNLTLENSLKDYKQDRREESFRRSLIFKPSDVVFFLSLNWLSPRSWLILTILGEQLGPCGCDKWICAWNLLADLEHLELEDDMERWLHILWKPGAEGILLESHPHWIPLPAWRRML